MEKYDIKLAYLASKLAKQSSEHRSSLYRLKEALLKPLIEDGTLTLRGFHNVGEYIYHNGFGMNTKRFYADYYETADKAWGFHLPRANGRGKGNLGEVRGLDQNTKTNKLTKIEIVELSKDPRINPAFQLIKAKEANEKKRVSKVLRQLKKQGYYEHVISGPYNDDNARFGFESVGKGKIKLTSLIADYGWSKKYNYNFKNVGDIITL